MFSGSSRRQILKLVGAFVAGAAVAKIPLIGKLFVGAVQAQPPPNINPARFTNYKGTRISIQANTAGSTADLPYHVPYFLSVENQNIDVIQDKQSGLYKTYLLPFSHYSSVTDLTKAIIDLDALGLNK